MKHVLGKDFKAGCRFEGWGMSKVFQISGLSRAMAFKKVRKNSQDKLKMDLIFLSGPQNLRNLFI